MANLTHPNTTLRFLGAGGAFSRHLGTTCSELRLADGKRWLIDCGRQAPDQLYHAGLSWGDVDGQIITHVHGDHTFGLEDFAFSRYFDALAGVPAIRQGGPKIPLVVHSAVLGEVWEMLRPSLRYAPSAPHGPGTAELDTYFVRAEPLFAEPARANPWPHAEAFEVGGLRVLLRETVHVPGKPSTSVEVRVGGPRGPDAVAWWSGDSTVDQPFLVAMEPRTTVFFHDCTFIDYPGQVHGAFRQLEQLPESVRRKMVLMHHEDDVEVHRQRVEALGFRVALPGHCYDLSTGLRIDPR